MKVYKVNNSLTVKCITILSFFRESEQSTETLCKNDESIDQSDNNQPPKKQSTQILSSPSHSEGGKLSSDAKNSQIRMVKGTKKMRIDSGDSCHTGDKKGGIRLVFLGF